MTRDNCIQEERIQKVEEAVEQIASQVSLTYTKISGIETKLEKALVRLSEHHSILYGERGSSGLLAWKERAAETVDELKLALKGYGDEPGLIAEIKNLSKKISEWDDTKKWITRLVIGYIVTVILGLIVMAGK